MILDMAKIDFEDARKASNTKWNVKIPEARDGIGGTCLPKDTRYLASLGSSHPLIDAAIEADKAYSQATRINRDSTSASDYDSIVRVRSKAARKSTNR